MCLTLPCHTSTLLRLVVQGGVFEASFLQSGFGQKKSGNVHHYDRRGDLICKVSSHNIAPRPYNI